MNLNLKFCFKSWLTIMWCDKASVWPLNHALKPQCFCFGVCVCGWALSFHTPSFCQNQDQLMPLGPYYQHVNGQSQSPHQHIPVTDPQDTSPASWQQFALRATTAGTRVLSVFERFVIRQCVISTYVENRRRNIWKLAKEMLISLQQ